MDKIDPGSVNWNDKTFQIPKIEAMKIARERERIAKFNNWVVKYGVLDSYTFPTESIHEPGALNLNQVCVCLRNLGIHVSISQKILPLQDNVQTVTKLCTKVITIFHKTKN